MQIKMQMQKELIIIIIIINYYVMHGKRKGASYHQA
jgi:hypothetical protein